MELDTVLNQFHDYTTDAVMVYSVSTEEPEALSLVYANNVFFDLTGFSKEAVLGRSEDCLFSGQSSEVTRRSVRDRLALRDFFATQLVFHRNDGSSFWAEVSFRPMRDGQGICRYWLSIFRDVSDIRSKDAQIEEGFRALRISEELAEFHANHDPLTGLPNRRRYIAVLEQLAERQRSAQGGLATLVVDISHFSEFNDVYGPEKGDEALIQVGKRIRNELRDGDTVARINGDHFGIVLVHGSNTPGLDHLAGRLLAALAEPYEISETLTARLAFNIGIATATGHSVRAGDLIEQADIARDKAACAGPNRIVYFDEALGVETRRKRLLADELLVAIEHGEIEPYYQPQISSLTGEIVAVEALARWRHPERGIIPPAEFLEAADRVRLIHEIDHTVLTKSLADFAAWRKAGHDISGISVNVSHRRLFDPKLFWYLTDLDFEPGTLTFELHEAIFLDNVAPEISGRIETLKEAGIGIEIDDFGTGHASIVSLTQLSPERLKIDRSLIAPMLDSPENHRLVALIVEIGTALGIRVTAEGVETAEQAAALTDLHVDRLQGYVFSKPLSAAEFGAMLGRGQTWDALFRFDQTA